MSEGRQRCAFAAHLCFRTGLKKTFQTDFAGMVSKQAAGALC